ncbi:MAG: hypothetical protein IPL63_12515 [Saprospiraceae bacterium]|nr:hypothetical protein [Saprospiraceae bacterium]
MATLQPYIPSVKNPGTKKSNPFVETTWIGRNSASIASALAADPLTFVENT